MTRIFIDAFRDGPWSSFIFPEHLRVQPGDKDEYDWRLGKFSATFESPNRYHVVAVNRSKDHDGKDGILGWAQWITASDQNEPKTGNEVVELPPSLDRANFEILAKEGQELDQFVRDALGKERGQSSWCMCSHVAFDVCAPASPFNETDRSCTGLNYLTVDPRQQRRGIGKMLTQWGIDEAAKGGKDVCLRSAPAGRRMYLSLGFEGVGEKEIIGGKQYGMIKKILQRYNCDGNGGC